MKKEIEFDFAKWGQEGVIALDQNGNDVLNIWKLAKPKNEWIYLIEVNNNEMPFFLNKFGKNEHAETKIKMFEEVKPREFWVNVYESGSMWVHNTHEIAIKQFENTIVNTPHSKGQTIKVREVIE